MTKRIVVTEFLKRLGKPMEIRGMTVLEERGHGAETYLGGTIYDVDLSRAYGYIFHESGSAGGGSPVKVSGPYHVRGQIEIEEIATSLIDSGDAPPYASKRTLAIRALNRTRRLRAFPQSLDGYADVLEWLQYHGIEQPAVYCSECADCMPESDLCEHCWWCEKVGEHSTPDDRCGCTNRAECEG